MRELLWEGRYVVVAVLCVVVYSVFEWQTTKDKVNRLMLAAKQASKDGFLNSGKEQEDWVVKTLMKLIPKPVAFFVNEESVRVLVKWSYGKAKDYLDDGEFNDSHLENK